VLSGRRRRRPVELVRITGRSSAGNHHPRQRPVAIGSAMAVSKAADLGQ
jgi:hypothetical protein